MKPYYGSNTIIEQRHKTEKSRSIALALQFPQDPGPRVEVYILAEKWYVEM